MHELARSNKDLRLQLSWDGMEEFQNAERGMHDTVISSLESMITLDNHVASHVQVTPAMVPKLLENVDYIVSKMGSKAKVCLRPIPEVPGWTDEVLQVLRSQMTSVFLKYEDKIEKVANCERMLSSSGICGAGKSFGTFTPSGDIYACHRFYFSKNRDFKVGDISTGFFSTRKLS